MTGWLFIAALLAFAGFFGWVLKGSLNSGIVPGSFQIHRTRHPKLFWANIGIIVFVALATGGLALFSLAAMLSGSPSQP